MFVISFPLTSVVMHDVYVRFNSMFVSFQSKNPAGTETKQNRRRKNRKKKEVEEKKTTGRNVDERRTKGGGRNKGGGKRSHRETNQRCDCSFVAWAVEGTIRIVVPSFRRLFQRTKVAADTRDRENVGSVSNLLSVSLSFSLCSSQYPIFPLYPLSRRLFPYVSRPFHRGTRNMDWKKETAMLPGAAYRTQKSPPSPLSRDFYCNRRADVDSRSSLSSLPVEDSTTIGNFLCRFRLYGLFTVEFLRIRLLVSVTILAQTSIPGIVYVCGELQCY